jgi:hypothetical protein
MNQRILESERLGDLNEEIEQAGVYSAENWVSEILDLSHTR